MDIYLQPKTTMTTQSNKQPTGLEDTELTKAQGLTLEATQGIIAKEMSKVLKKLQKSGKAINGIVEAVQKVEIKAEQHLLALEAKVDNLEQNMKHMNEKVKSTGQAQDQYQQALDNISTVVQAMGQDMIVHHENIQDIFNQVDSERIILG